MNTNATRFITMSASANMPNSCWGQYGRCAVVELEPGFVGVPKMISERARGIKRIVALWDRLNCGGRYSASGIAWTEAQDLCQDLNGEWGHKAQAQMKKLYRIN